jgi:hypothetical protein
VQLTHKSYREWKSLEPFYAIFQGDDIVPDFAEVLWAPLHSRAGLCLQQFPQRGLGAFDPAGKDCLPSNERSHEEMRIRQASAFSGEPSYSAIGSGEHRYKIRRPGEIRWKGGGDEGMVALQRSNLPAG